MESLKRFAGFAMSMMLAGAALLWVVFVVEEMNSYGGLIGLAAGVVVFGWLAQGPVGKGIGRLLEGSGSRSRLEPSAEFLDLQDQVAALSLELQRVTDLEDRLDFAERIMIRNSAEVSGGNDG